MELRCPNKFFGELDGRGDGALTVRCHSKFCGYGRGVVVEHKFDLATGKLSSTNRFKDPKKEGDGS